MIRISRLTDLHACPLPLHGITPLVSGAADVQVNGLPVARVGDRSGCGAVLVSGFPHILVNGRPMAHLGSLSSHGGAVLAGSGDTFGGSQNGTQRPPLVVDFARLGVMDEQGRLDDQRLQALLDDPQLEQHARQAGALIDPDKAPTTPRSYACSFQAIDSETRRPLAHRPFHRDGGQ